MSVLIRSFLFNLCFYLWMILFMILAIPSLLLPRCIAVELAKTWSRGVFWLLAHIVGIHFEIRGRENLIAPPAIVALKHQSAWETIALELLMKDPIIILKKELTYIPLYGLLIYKFGFIPLDRKGGRKSIQTLMERADRMKATGRYLAIFPEGTRTSPGKRGHYHRGIALLYECLNMPVIPVALNSGLLWGRRQFLKRPGTIIVELLPPIQPGLTRDAFMDKLEESIENASLRLFKETTLKQRET